MSRISQVPTLGKFQLTHELKRDGLGILYEGFYGEDADPVIVRTIAPAISNNENFIVRFELLRNLLPKVSHKNLVKIIDLDCDQNVFYIAKQVSMREHGKFALQTLETYDPSDTTNRHRTLETLFEGIAKGLQALLSVRDNYHKDGILHQNLSLEQIYLDFEKPLVGNTLIPVPKIDGFGEPFLYFGDDPQAILHYRMANPSYRWLHKGDVKEAGITQLFSHEHIFCSDSRRGQTANYSTVLYQLGTLIYHVIAKLPCKGRFPKLQEIDPTLDPLWDKIADLCLYPYRKSELHSIDEVLSVFSEMSAKRNQLSPRERQLRKLQIPEGMALVAIDDKVELGAKDGPSEEQPRFRARLEPFLIDVAPVTNEEFQSFLPSYQASCYSRSHDQPATQVSWHMANAYCRWRSKKEGLPEDSYRLPTEYEWEAAVRGAHGDQFPWGPTANWERITCHLPPDHGSTAVKQFPSGRFGLYDMLGNVWEWTHSLFKPHPFSKSHDRRYQQDLRVVKGGCWLTPRESIRASLRAAYHPHETRANIGFRCVRPIQLEDT